MSDPVTRDVIIIGAGASGLFCAIECGTRGRSVLVLDHGDRICSKVLISGGGRCNFTNLIVTPAHYFSSNPHFCRSALARFTPEDMLAMLKAHRIPYHEKEAGQLFCSRSSRDIVAMLRQECQQAGVQIRLQERIAGVEREGHFKVTTDRGVYVSSSLVVATGGLSYPALGASRFGHDLARQFGIPVTELRPALVPFVFSKHDRILFSPLAGVSLNVRVTCSGRTFAGGILFTHNGLSGPAALQASSSWKEGAALSIDLLPEIDLAALFQSGRRSRAELKTLLARSLPRRFAEAWCDLYSPSRPLVQYNDRELHMITERLHGWEVRPAGTEGYDRAEVTLGGIDTSALSSKTMESKTTPGLYFIGEVLDVTGHLGGYNLHWAWASGRAAGQHA
jgi:predicted Rossmann fold flavoprotein